MNRVTIDRAGPGEYYVRCECGYLTRRSGHKARESARRARRDHVTACQNVVIGATA